MTDIRVLRGDPTPEQVAALAIALIAAIRPRTTTPQAARAPWPRSQAPTWASNHLPGWTA
ncbi:MULTISPECIES: acyl-CoA carboxylase epsilon subunit [Saccharothrix]|uniref:acyl-CoA carboxylase epsilon subunit n=1 Tax=Saccharothrix TaxID=2071 RepID=UPI001300FFC2|nr:acyl-CoA carboxylase epsilon subunit [Saccharothrix sp. CB00851]